VLKISISWNVKLVKRIENQDTELLTTFNFQYVKISESNQTVCNTGLSK